MQTIGPYRERKTVKGTNKDYKTWKKYNKN